MALKNATASAFAADVGSGITIVDFWAPWCGPCRAFAPVFEAASKRHDTVTFLKVNTDAEGELATTFQIRSIPTIMAFRDGVPLFAQPGMMGAADLDALIDALRKVDMADVQRKLSEHARDAGAARR
jgi:thioredoxin